MLNADPSLAQLSLLLAPASFVVDGYIGLGVFIGTDAFIQHFVKDKCQAILEDIEASSTTGAYGLPSDPAAISQRPCAAREPQRATTAL